MAYNPREIEPKWQKYWIDRKVFRATENPNKKKYFVLDMFPYPSAEGLHVGHVLGYTATDITTRYYKMCGYEVLHPMGWDAFGLPAEQHAIKTGEHPEKVTRRCIANFKNQLHRLGMAYDWEREFATCDPDYYKWTQKIFKILYEKGLAYQAEIQVNWCPELKTVLANEEVIDGKSERGGHPVFRVPMRQWMLKITAYAERLVKDLDKVDWPDSIKDIQRNWIGRSTGARISFAVKGMSDKSIEVFTTRPDTIFGATYMVLAPEHPLVDQLTSSDKLAAVKAYREQASQKSDLARTELSKEKTGVFTGGYALHPFTNEPIPVWMSDYVLMNYGTGAIMAVPAHDERDHDFAKAFGLPIKEVIRSKDALNVQDKAFEGDGVAVNSQFLDGLGMEEAKKKAIEVLEAKSLGRGTINYKLRDWLFSRQRYWGEPFPVLKDSDGQVARLLRDDELPLSLPEVKSYVPTDDGKSPLQSERSWVERKEGNKTLFVETDTMPGWAGSSWYFLRYCDPKNDKTICDMEKAKYWMPVDLYIGGQEHAVLHLLYARFWTKVLYDAGMCPVEEPFHKLVNQGMICRDGHKMSKSKGNGVDPISVIEEFGADTLRVYEMFMGPLTQTKEWDDSNLAGVHRFLTRIARHFLDEEGRSLAQDTEPNKADLRMLHKSIKKISQSIEAQSFNTCISQMMIFLNHLADTKCHSRAVLRGYVQLLGPFAPHFAEELWLLCGLGASQNMNSKDYVSLAESAWPSFDPNLAQDDEVTIGVQISGKHRGEITIGVADTEVEAVKAAWTNPQLASALEGKTIVKTIFVKGRILNFVIK